MRGAIAVIALVVAACGDAQPDMDPDTGEDRALRALVDSLLPVLEHASGLDALGPVRVERRSSAEVRAFVERQLNEELPPERLEGITETYALLGLIPDTLDLRRLLLDLYTEQIVGYYDPDTKTLYAVEQVPRDALRPVVAHELVHALQDQHANIDSLIAPSRGNDRQIAAQAALEGHAMLVMLGIAASDAAGEPIDPTLLPDPGEQLRAGLEQQNSQFPVFQRAPRALREMLVFPYSAGAAFVRELWAAAPSPDQRVAPLGDRLPQSTEQVLWPLEAFATGRDDPTELRAATPPPWRVVYENTLGAFEVRLFLEQHLGRGDSRGWDGDRYHLLEGPAGERALVWTSIWDDGAFADRFASSVRRIIDAGSLPVGASVATGVLEGRPIVRVTMPAAGTAAENVPLVEVRCADEGGRLVACTATDAAALR